MIQGLHCLADKLHLFRNMEHIHWVLTVPSIKDEATGNWKDGDDVIIPLSVKDEEVIKQKYPKGYTSPRPYLRITPQPNK